MADSHPFSNAGLGMFGSAERQFAGRAMNAQKPDANSENNFDLLGFLGGLIGLSDQEKARTQQTESGKTKAIAPPAPQYEPQTAFPEVLQQQYVTPYQPGYGSNAPIQPPTTSLQGFMTPQYRAPQPSNPMAGFKTPSQYSAQPQVSASGHLQVTDALWGQ